MALRIGLGGVVRVAVVLGWLGFYGWHVARYALPGLGLVERRDLAALLAVHLERAFTYRVLTASRRVIGRGDLTVQQDDTRFRIDSALDLDELPVPVLALAGLPDGEPRVGQAHLLSLRAGATFDDRYRLIAVDGSLNFLAMQAVVRASTGPGGLSGRIEVDGLGTPFARDFAVPGADQVQGLSLIPCLPPGLRVGDRFTARQLAFDATALRPTLATAVYTVEQATTVPAGRQSVAVLEVAVQVDGKPQSTLWCDQHGTVYLMRTAEGGMQLELTAVRVLNGPALWPPDKAGRTPVPPGGGR